MHSNSSLHLLQLARDLANQLITPIAPLDQKALFQVLQKLPGELYSLESNRVEEARGVEHMLHIVRSLEAPQWPQALKRIRRPTAHQGAEQLIRHSLLLASDVPIQDYHAQRAALSALLMPLRQNVGSCFATAPAILIQASQPLQFLADIAQLFGTGSLKRTFGGMEYTVPLTVNAGLGSLLLPIDWTLLGGAPLEKLGRAPDLMAAFRAAGVLNDQNKHCEALLKRVLQLEEAPFAALTPDDLIQRVLRYVHKVTPDEVENYKKHAAKLSLINLQGAPTSKKESAIAAYLRAYKEATEAFVAQTDHPLLKAWEFTLASFAEVKADISRWNLYISLGFEPSKPFGIGEAIQNYVQHKLDQINEELAALQSRYDHTFAQAKSLEGRIRSATTEQEAAWIQAEYRLRREEIDRVLVEQDRAYDKGRQLASALRNLADFYLIKFPDYFQEVYDPELREIEVHFYDDAPAGFRLLYKHGRSNPAVWTWIHHPAEYLNALTSFFTLTEIELAQHAEFKVIGKEISELITAIVHAIKEDRFLIYSFRRLAEAYQLPFFEDPLEHLEQIERKPWSYRSGGTMSTLVSTYYNRTAPPSEMRRWVESELELLVFYLDTIKDLPLSVQNRMLEQPNQLGLLAFSPTHAFLLKPGWQPFAEGWQSQAYTYSWVRDHWLNPSEAFWDEIWLGEEQKAFFIKSLLELFPAGYRAVISQALKDLSSQKMRSYEFRANILDILSYEKWLKPALGLLSDTMDQLLYEIFPLCNSMDVAGHLLAIWDAMEEVDDSLKTRLIQTYQAQDVQIDVWVTPKQLREIAATVLMLTLKKSRSNIFYFRSLVEAMRKTKRLPPAPILFADPNWPEKTFGFIVSPATLKLELWVLDTLGTSGRPLSQWKPYLDGRDRRDWGLYIKPSEYT